MASSLEDLTTKFDLLSHKIESFQEMMKESLDKWSRMEAWQMMADESFGALLHQMTTVAERADTATAPINQLEHRPPPPPPPPPSSYVLPLPQAFPAASDLNRVAHPSPRSSEGTMSGPVGTGLCKITGCWVRGSLDPCHARSWVRILALSFNRILHNFRRWSFPNSMVIADGH